MFVRVVRFTDVTAERVESLVARIDETGPVFGPYRTFQVPVRDVESVALLDFGPLRATDPLADDDDQGPAAAGGRWREIHSYGDIVLRPI